MTIDVDGIKRLMRSHRAQYDRYLVETNDDIVQTKQKLQHLNIYKEQLMFHLNKSAKILDIIEIDELNKKSFSTIPSAEESRKKMAELFPSDDVEDAVEEK